MLVRLRTIARAVIFACNSKPVPLTCFRTAVFAWGMDQILGDEAELCIVRSMWLRRFPRVGIPQTSSNHGLKRKNLSLVDLRVPHVWLAPNKAPSPNFFDPAVLIATSKTAEQVWPSVVWLFYIAMENFHP